MLILKKNKKNKLGSERKNVRDRMHVVLNEVAVMKKFLKLMHQ